MSRIIPVFFVLLATMALLSCASLFTNASPIRNHIRGKTPPKKFLKHVNPHFISHPPLGAPQPGDAGSFTLIYQTNGWTSTFLHYNADNRGWNSVPGDKMSCPPTNETTYPCASYNQISVYGNHVVFVTTNGAGQWNNDGGKNFDAASPGVWLVQGSTLTQLSTAPTGCPDACSDHGTCNSGTYTCTCADGYYGATCQYSCPSSCTANLHERCSNTNGSCVCQTGWESCSGQSGCLTNTASDVNNCGSCGNNCNKQPHVLAATCISGVCNVTCTAGFLPCDDGTCRTSCPLPGCNTYALNNCKGNAVNTSTIFANNNWQTPKRSNPGWRPSYQDLSDLKGYVDYRYSSPERKTVLLTVRSQTKDPQATVTCSWGGSPFGACSKLVSSPAKGPMSVAMRAVDTAGKTYNVQLEEVDFFWDHPTITYAAGDYRNGTKGAVVEFFGWPHNDVAEECEFLSKAGYLAAKVYPPMEHIMSVEPFNNVMNPWYFEYQPVSYAMRGRVGTRKEFRDAINKCRSFNVMIFADSVNNHMTGSGSDSNPHHRNGEGNSCVYWPAKNSSADFPPTPGGMLNGTAPMFTQGFTYEPAPNSGLAPMQEFPSVPYGPEDFHCQRPLNSWNDPLDLDCGWLVGLVDIQTSSEHVRERIAAYWTDLASLGVGGLRLDAAKHIAPWDLGAIFGKFKRNMGGQIPASFSFYLEVLLGGETSLLVSDPTSPYSYSVGLVNELVKNGLTESEINCVRLWWSAFPNFYGQDLGELSPLRKVIQNDDSDQQNPGSTSRDMHGKGSVLVIDKNIDLHRQFEIQLFQDPLGVPDNANDSPIRNVLSSYWLPANANDYGVPDGLSNCDVCQVNCESCDPAQSLPKVKAHVAGSPGYTGNFVAGHFTRVHRDNQIINAMRGWMNLPPVDTKDFGNI